MKHLSEEGQLTTAGSYRQEASHIIVEMVFSATSSMITDLNKNVQQSTVIILILRDDKLTMYGEHDDHKRLIM